MNLTFVLIGFALAVFMGAGIVSLMATLCPQWSNRRRQLTAASILPGITAVATGLGILFISTADHGQGERMEDMAIAALATLGGGAVLVAFAGGLIGAMLAGRRRGG
jgi:ABC-type Mn2+/Zn2+ transport system permease subunit